MDNNCIWFVAIGVLACMPYCVCPSVVSNYVNRITPEPTPKPQVYFNEPKLEVQHKDLQKSCATIDEYLAENVQSDDFGVIEAKLKELLGSKKPFNSILFRKSLVMTLEKVLYLPKLNPDGTHCGLPDRLRAMEGVDVCLNQESRRENPNYQLTYLDKFIEYYAYKTVRQCGLGEDWPKMDHGLKQAAYDKIDEYLVAQLPESDDAEANLAKAEEYLKSLDPQDGSLALALKQFLTLRTVTGDDSCNEQSYEVLLRNFAGIRGQGVFEDADKQRRIVKVFKHFAKTHREICFPKIRSRIDSGLKELDQDTYRRMLGLVGFSYIENRQYPEFAESLNHKEVNEDFTVPLITEYAKSLPEKSFHFEDSPHLDHFRLRSFVQEEYRADPNYEYLAGLEKRRTMERQFKTDDQKGIRLIKRYVYTPCDNFRKVFEEFMDANEFGRLINGNEPNMLVTKDLTYHTVRAAHLACKQFKRGTELEYFLEAQLRDHAQVTKL